LFSTKNQLKIDVEIRVRNDQEDKT